jgi:hypothetical protein
MAGPIRGKPDSASSAAFEARMGKSETRAPLEGSERRTQSSGCDLGSGERMTAASRKVGEEVRLGRGRLIVEATVE